jgi:uncharacterized protein (DUF697 family)
MPNVGGAKGFWNILKSVSVTEITREANRPVNIAIVGTPESRAEAMTRLYQTENASTTGEELEPVQKAIASPFIHTFDSTSPDAGFPDQPGMFDFVIDTGGGRSEATVPAPIYSVDEMGGWDEMIGHILEDRHDLALALARNLPALRPRVAQNIIQATATANAQFALVTGVAEAIPLAAWLLPVNSLSDIVVLTKNQTLMVLRLAAIYGLSLDYRSRMKEVAPILGNAFGWRAIARELTGAIPFVGFLVRASIAYAGTVTVGKAAQVYYETGETLTRAQLRKLYHDAYDGAREKVRKLAGSTRRVTANRQRAIAAAPEASITSETAEELEPIPPKFLDAEFSPVAAEPEPALEE